MITTPDFLTKPTLTGDRTILRPFQSMDIPVMEAILVETEVIRLTGSASSTEEANQPLSIEDKEQIAQFYSTRNQQTERIDLAIVSKKDGECVGEVVLNEWDNSNRCCNFRILIGEAGRGQGIGSEAIRLLVSYAFEHLDLHRIELEVYSFNPCARHVYEKAGFKQEGTKREVLQFDGQWIDSHIMAMLESDYYNK